MITKLTKRSVEAVQPLYRDEFLWDSDLTNFGCKITPTGKRVYFVQYRINGRRRRYTIGQHGPVTPDQARQEALKLLGQVASGLDPAEIKGKRGKTPTVTKLAERYLIEHAELKKKARSVHEDKRMIKDFVLPALGNLKTEAVNRQDIAKLHHDLRDTPFQANRVMALCSKMFNLAEKWGLRPDSTNPCRHVERYKETKRERFLSGNELSRLGEVMSEAELEELPSAILAIRLLLFTGCRLSEILTLRWSEVDLERGVLNLTDSKTGSKLVALPGPALDVLLEAPRIDGNPFVCPGVKTGSHLVGLQKIWERIRSRANLDDLRLHDLRHSFASVAAAANMGLPVIGKLLGHTQAATTARYAHLAIDPLKAASEEVAKRIDEGMKKKPQKGKVIEINKKRKSN